VTSVGGFGLWSIRARCNYGSGHLRARFPRYVTCTVWRAEEVLRNFQTSNCFPLPAARPCRRVAGSQRLPAHLQRCVRFVPRQLDAAHSILSTLVTDSPSDRAVCVWLLPATRRHSLTTLLPSGFRGTGAHPHIHPSSFTFTGGREKNKRPQTDSSQEQYNSSNTHSHSLTHTLRLFLRYHMPSKTPLGRVAERAPDIYTHVC
jgi:hypothetical protein